jgi:hypothetical protein
MGQWVQREGAHEDDNGGKRAEQVPDIAAGAISWSSAEEWTIELPSAPIRRRQQTTTDEDPFWPTYSWANNPRIKDFAGAMLKPSKYDRIQPCTIEELCIRRTSVNTYTMKIPTVNGKMHRQDKLRRWGIPILLVSPILEIGEQLTVSKRLRMRHVTKLDASYDWEATTSGHARGISTDLQTGDQHVLVVDQQADGKHWRVGGALAADEVTRHDQQKLRSHEAEGSIVFYAHPRVHGFEWSVPETIANRHVVQALKKQPFRRFRGDGPSIRGQLRRLEQAAKSSTWQAAVMQQTPQQLWRHQRALTEYQVWVAYRVATRQLNLFHEERTMDNSCRKLPRCAGTKETLEHVFWDCPVAKACWQKLTNHWMEECWSTEQLQHVQRNCANHLNRQSQLDGSKKTAPTRRLRSHRNGSGYGTS